MAKVTNKKDLVEKKKVEEEKPKSEENIELQSLNEESSLSEEESEIEGLSEAESEDEDGSKAQKHKIKTLDPKKKKQQTQEKDSNKKKPLAEYSSILYVSRLPQGFHERELSKYFSQFGDLKEVRLARNKKTGNSRHYGFIEFANKDDANIAQDAMNNYLVMGHLLQVRLLPKGAKIEKLYKYKKRAFTQMKIKKTAKELKERAHTKHEERMNKLTEAGIDFAWE
ncbi:hypothetical protein NCAS_0G02580 [Naumovozyma castellii]|uniref:RRM domain-containing protein n=1 Tax=Naumovozyma castellii TaxID=27288 RepID=G0VIB0_NAUCA|nr:hypothetical protein NCAS_0G02580 [Naumovozyma castellii CBS 4309]CCC71145.1 hypothetical protein NCAS_0G02580 [Naumovozyma castellii CBS 4309]